MTKLMPPDTVNWRSIVVPFLLAIFLAGLSTRVLAQTGADVRATKHNLSKFSKGTTPNPNTIKATDETQVCVFCHTPHGANTSAKTPLWNRASAPDNTYTRYTSSSLDANTIADGFRAQPGGSSLLCLSCHDGMIALGNVNVLNGKSSPPTVAGLTGTMATLGAGSGSNTGFTRNLGTDLSNDHPISITYNNALALQDNELARLSTAAPAQRDVDTTGTLIGIRSSGYKPLLPLEPTSALGAGQVQCATCHDPHTTKDRFLRLNRFQTTLAPGAAFSQANDQICLACHRKLGTTWANSAHANTTTAAYVYKDDASLVRGFPRPSDALAPPLKKVWEVACLNCHDTHTASGSRRLLREGTGATPSTTSAAFQAGSTTRPLEKESSIENTCYQCHTTPTINILTVPTMTAITGVPDIKSEFDRVRRKPIRTADQIGTGNTNTVEVHDITNADFIESDIKLGKGATSNRHVECTDCHNPHRVIKNALFNGLGATDRRTHVPAASTATELTGSGGNIASGALRGIWGVQPTYPLSSTTWPDNPTYTVKKGDPGGATATTKDSTYLTREYQLCFKCHSNYANSDLASGFPVLGNTGGGTPTGTNGLSRYTNVAAEFAANANDALTGTDQGEAANDPLFTPGNPNGAPNGAPINHRSWHPVVFPTGRTRLERTNSATVGAFGNIRAPFNVDANIGKQTMQCSDCHGEPTSWTQNTGPDLTKVQGPHGSSNDFLLKGNWSIASSITGASGTTPSTTSADSSVCGRCHNPGGGGGFSSGSASHSASVHAGRRCMFCHVAVPHGWKNKNLLVNLNCLGPEAGKPAGCTSAFGGATNDTKQLWAAPYYNGAVLRVTTWRSSTAWTTGSCGDGRSWMNGACPNAATTQQAQTPMLPTTGGY